MDVFVYGTLTDPARASALLSDFSFRGSATLHGLHRIEGRYPTLAPGGRTDGRLLRTSEVERLDAYEGVDRGLYVRVSVPIEDGNGNEAAVYVGDAGALCVPDAVPWPGGGPLRDQVARYVREEGVLVRLPG